MLIGWWRSLIESIAVHTLRATRRMEVQPLPPPCFKECSVKTSAYGRLATPPRGGSDRVDKGCCPSHRLVFSVFGFGYSSLGDCSSEFEGKSFYHSTSHSLRTSQQILTSVYMQPHPFPPSTRGSAGAAGLSRGAEMGSLSSSPGPLIALPGVDEHSGPASFCWRYRGAARAMSCGHPQHLPQVPFSRSQRRALGTP
jgi:hypothetical protein